MISRGIVSNISSEHEFTGRITRRGYTMTMLEYECDTTLANVDTRMITREYKSSENYSYAVSSQDPQQDNDLEAKGRYGRDFRYCRGLEQKMANIVESEVTAPSGVMIMRGSTGRI